jgi:hypothetical protein
VDNQLDIKQELQIGLWELTYCKSNHRNSTYEKLIFFGEADPSRGTENTIFYLNLGLFYLYNKKYSIENQAWFELYNRKQSSY